MGNRSRKRASLQQKKKVRNVKTIIGIMVFILFISTVGVLADCDMDSVTILSKVEEVNQRAASVERVTGDMNVNQKTIIEKQNRLERDVQLFNSKASNIKVELAIGVLIFAVVQYIAVTQITEKRVLQWSGKSGQNNTGTGSKDLPLPKKEQWGIPLLQPSAPVPVPNPIKKQTKIIEVN